MTEKLAPLPPQFPGQDNTTVFRGAYWLSPDAVRAYIAEAIRQHDEEILGKQNISFHAAPPGHDPKAVQEELDRQEEEREAAENEPLVALTDEQILVAAHAALKSWIDGHVPIWNPKIVVARAVIAAHCRLNGLTEPKP